MGRGGVYKSDKRKKELLRQKKQEEKRQRRFKKDAVVDENAEAESSKETEAAVDHPEA
ncbi:MAG: hypothetical protein HY754_10265 [Nitrospirae bacterium]|nr:hypothetical protein [Nitrospirota bacterium]